MPERSVGTLDGPLAHRSSPDMKVTAGRGGWFDFSIAWHAEQANVKDGCAHRCTIRKPYVKTEDGQLVSLSNAPNSSRWLICSHTPNRTKTEASRRRCCSRRSSSGCFERAKTARLEAMDRGFEIFLKEVKAETGRADHVSAAARRCLASVSKDGAVDRSCASTASVAFSRDEMGLGKTLEVLSLFR